MYSDSDRLSVSDRRSPAITDDSARRERDDRTVETRKPERAEQRTETGWVSNLNLDTHAARSALAPPTANTVEARHWTDARRHNVQTPRRA